MRSTSLGGASLVLLGFAAGGLACTGGASPTTETNGDASSSGTSSGGSSSGSSPATPQVIFDGKLESGGRGECADVGTLFQVGDFGSTTASPPIPAKPVKNGESFASGTASVVCSVIPGAAGEHRVQATVSLSGAAGGSFRVDGTFRSSGEQPDLHVVASRQQGTSYESTACTARYATAFQGVAAGRLWAEVRCPDTSSTDGGSCGVIAELRLENCGQQ